MLSQGEHLKRSGVPWSFGGLSTLHTLFTDCMYITDTPLDMQCILMPKGF